MRGEVVNGKRKRKENREKEDMRGKGVSEVKKRTWKYRTRGVGRIEDRRVRRKRRCDRKRGKVEDDGGK